MKTRTFAHGTGTFAAYQSLAVTIQSGTKSDITAQLIAMASAAAKPQQRAMLNKLLALVATGQPQYAIFKMDGNSKLPFVAFSSLPGVTCPGAGQCLQFCYSYRAWRFAHSFGRMAQNAYLMRFAPHLISNAARQLPAVTLRLYVDGDFSSAADVNFWFSILRANPQISAYGYSKSFAELLQYRGPWPTNYRLNISSGHDHNAATVAKIRALPITRGEFKAISIGRVVKSSDHGTAATNAALRAATGERIFPCPGTCGTCTPKGHACGSERFKGIPIAIAIH